MVAPRHHSWHFRFSMRVAVRWVQHLSMKADTGVQHLQWVVAPAEHNVAGRAGIHMEQQVVPLSQQYVGAVAHDQVIAVLEWEGIDCCAEKACEVGVIA